MAPHHGPSLLRQSPDYVVPVMVPGNLQAKLRLCLLGQTYIQISWGDGYNTHGSDCYGRAPQLCPSAWRPQTRIMIQSRYAAILRIAVVCSFAALSHGRKPVTTTSTDERVRVRPPGTSMLFVSGTWNLIVHYTGFRAQSAPGDFCRRRYRARFGVF